MCDSEKNWTGTDNLYWDERAGKEYVYKKEKFYTITPVPYYYARRKIIIKKIKKIISENHFINICDFGCGDGEYIRKLQENRLMFHGVDSSRAMIKLANRNLQYGNISFEVSEDGIKEDKVFDLVYSSAIWAHIGDLQCQILMKNIYDHLRIGGMFILCEQSAPFKYGGGNLFDVLVRSIAVI